MTTPTFADLGLSEVFTGPLAAKGITEPFEIQALAIPLAVERNDLIGQARTGSGKTLAFGLPALHHVDPSYKEAQALIVTPTRELCLQIVDDLTHAASESDITVTAVYGGVPIEPQAEALTGGAHVIVGTPGRLLDHLGRRNLDLSTIRTLVLDEADEMLDMGFLPDVERLISACPVERQTLLFSATMRNEIVELARRYLDKPTFLRAQDEELSMPAGIEHHFFLTHKLDKPRVLARVLQQPGRGLAVVFTRTKYMADRLVEELGDLGIDAIAIHGDLRQQTRERNLGRFRDNKVDVLVATEVAARGLDIDGMTHVINYDCPDDEKMYIHRVGRTARAGEKGVAVTFATHAEVDRLNMVRRALDIADEPLPEVFSTSDELTERFDLPAETPWAHLSRNGGGTRDGGAKRSSDRKRDGRKRDGESRGGRKRGGDGDGGRKRGGESRGARGSDGGSERTGRGGGEGRKPRTSDGKGRDRTPVETAGAVPASKASDDDAPVRKRTRTRSRTTSSDERERTTAEGEEKRSSDRSRDRSRERSKGTSKGGAKSSGATRERSSSSTRRKPSTPREPVAATESSPRGEGQPRLARPLKVDHIP